jgi:ribosomal 30S subunit maturation factor RimM
MNSFESSSENPSELVTLGTVGKPHGLKGSFHWEGRSDLLDPSLFSYCLIKKHPQQAPSVDVTQLPQSEDADLPFRNWGGKKKRFRIPRRISRRQFQTFPVWQKVSIQECRWQGDVIVGRLNIASTREQIEEWRGAEIKVDATHLVSRPERGVVYWADLIGRKVLSSDGRDLGVMDSLYNGGASDIGVIHGGSFQLEFPLVADFIELAQVSTPADCPIQLKLTYEQLEPLQTPTKSQEGRAIQPEMSGVVSRDDLEDLEESSLEAYGDGR